VKRVNHNGSLRVELQDWKPSPTKRGQRLISPEQQSRRVPLLRLSAARTSRRICSVLWAHL